MIIKKLLVYSFINICTDIIIDSGCTLLYVLITQLIYKEICKVNLILSKKNCCIFYNVISPVLKNLFFRNRKILSNNFRLNIISCKQNWKIFACSKSFSIFHSELALWIRPKMIITAWKVSKYRVFSGTYFPAFGLNTERYGVYSVSLRIQSECGKIRSRKNSVFGHFWRSK